MAAVRSYLRSNLQGGRLHLAVGFFSKANRLGAAAAVAGSRRGVHTASAYEKNLEDGIRPAALVPDDVIGGAGGGSHKHYWAPNPATGVFGPATGTASTPADVQHQQVAARASSVLDQPAWFRTVDEVDVPLI